MRRPRVPLLVVVVFLLVGLLTVVTFAGTPTVEPRKTSGPKLVAFEVGDPTCDDDLPEPRVTTRQDDGSTVVDVGRRATPGRNRSLSGTLDRAGPATYVLAVEPVPAETRSLDCTPRVGYDATVRVPHRGTERFTLVVTHDGRLVTVVSNAKGQATVTDYGTRPANATANEAVSVGGPSVKESKGADEPATGRRARSDMGLGEPRTTR